MRMFFHTAFVWYVFLLAGDERVVGVGPGIECLILKMLLNLI